MKKVAICVSGELGFIVLQHLLQRNITPTFIFTDINSLKIIECCSTNQLPFFSGNPRNKNWDELKQNMECDILLSVNYLYIIAENLLNWAKEYNLNIHGSLLPKYRGRTPHVWAIINGEQVTGVTVHEMEKEVDAGRILFQEAIAIDFNDTGASILTKFQAIYPLLIDKIIICIEKNEWFFSAQDENKSTYFGKRTPDDGHINWSWHRDRIRNWIRAQAYPYPGAFFYLEGNKISVNKSSFSDKGFNYLAEDGEILEVGTDFIIVKTPNGALQLEDIQVNSFDIFNIGSKLS